MDNLAVRYISSTVYNVFINHGVWSMGPDVYERDIFLLN